MSDRRMFKYPLFRVQQPVFDDRITILAPPSLGIEHIGMQNGVVTMWTLVECDAREIERTFVIAGTGHSLEPVGNYLGTVFDRQFVWHIFEVFKGSWARRSDED
jgi:hypothetical protein